jgi:uncharacterized protein YndB with AHSA1/START domain
VDERRSIVWRIHLRSSPEEVFRILSTPEGRTRFWSVSSEEEDETIRFVFSNGQRLDSRVLERSAPHRFTLTYFGGSRASFELRSDGEGGTDLTLAEVGVPPQEYEENLAGWVTVLLVLKAAVDFGADLRNHTESRTWEERYVDV